MTDKTEKPRISGKEATHAAMEAEKYGPIRIHAANDSPPNSNEPADMAQVPAQVKGTPDGGHARKAPPRVRKPSSQHDQYLAPTPDLEGYRARLREAFGNTMSDEFVDVMLGKVVEALKPSPFDKLEEPTFNAALAIIDSMQCRSELEALMAVEIIATGFSGLRFLRQSHKNMTEEYISVYGNYANKLLKLQMGLMQALDRHRRGHKQTVEVRYLHIHSGAQGSLELSTPLKKTMRVDLPKMTHDPMRQTDIERRLANLAKAPRCGAKTRAGSPCRQAAVKGRARCRMHGGAKGSGGPRGARNGNFKHGLWTTESKRIRRETGARARQLRRFLRRLWAS